MANDVVFKGTVESFQGVKLPYALEYEATYSPFANADAVRAAGKWPSETEIVDLVNNKAKASARATAITARLDEEYKKTNNPVFQKLDASTPEGQRENLIKSILKANQKFTRERAEKMADSMIAAES